MKQFACGVLLFGLGLVIGTAGTDGTLLEEAARRESASYNKGYTDALVKFQAVAVSAGIGRWDYNPHSGKADHFVWMVGQQEGEVDALPGSDAHGYALTVRPERPLADMP